jgi:hypothetical protein
MTDSPEEGAGRRVYDVPDLRPGGDFMIEVLDLEHNPMQGVEFGYSVDEGERRTVTTDDNGILMVVTNGHPERIDLYLEGEEEDQGAGSETNQAAETQET